MLDVRRYAQKEKWKACKKEKKKKKPNKNEFSPPPQ